jgi:hypothetical protein
MNPSYNLTGLTYLGNSLNSPVEIRRSARNLFDRAYQKGLLRRLLTKLTGGCTALRTLAHSPVIQTHRSSRIALVPLESIVGSEGRSEDFDDKFNPLKTHNLERWIGIVVARRSGVALPPVELVRDADGYYVRDGHHRISVAKVFGQLEIEAVIVNG